MLGGEHPGGERIRRVAGQNRHRGLGDDRAVVHRRADIVDRAAMDLDAGIERAGVGVQSGEGGEQRGVDVDQPVAPALDEVLREKPHEAGEADELDAGRTRGARRAQPRTPPLPRKDL